jgi:RNA polymerase sigma-70 factor, ECF subfamily
MVSFSPSVLAAREDARWIRETLLGNTAAFGNLVSKYQDRLFRSMVLVAGSPHDALDLVQDAFLQAMLKLDTFQSQSRFYTWLYRIAYNLALMALERTKRQRRISARIAAARRSDRTRGHRNPAAGGGPELQMEREEICRQVRAAIAEMEEVHRAVLVLREIDGLCYGEIARILGLPKGTIRSRLHRARIRLLERLRFSLVSTN